MVFPFTEKKGKAMKFNASITLYSKENAGGVPLEYDTAISDLHYDIDYMNIMDGKVGSCIVHSGIWVLYSERDFANTPALLFPKYENGQTKSQTYNLSDTTISGDKIWSLRPVKDTGITLFRNTSYGNTMLWIPPKTSFPELSKYNFNNRASSAVVGSGNWELFRYDDYNENKSNPHDLGDNYWKMDDDKHRFVRFFGRGDDAIGNDAISSLRSV